VGAEDMKSSRYSPQDKQIQ